MFTKQHYKAIAEIILVATRSITWPDEEITRIAWYLERKELVSNLIDYFAEDNPRFDKDKFLSDCGVK